MSTTDRFDPREEHKPILSVVATYLAESDEWLYAGYGAVGKAKTKIDAQFAWMQNMLDINEIHA